MKVATLVPRRAQMGNGASRKSIAWMLTAALITVASSRSAHAATVMSIPDVQIATGQSAVCVIDNVGPKKTLTAVALNGTTFCGGSIPAGSNCAVTFTLTGASPTADVFCQFTFTGSAKSARVSLEVIDATTGAAIMAVPGY
jgi:hypothetical protein